MFCGARNFCVMAVLRDRIFNLAESGVTFLREILHRFAYFYISMVPVGRFK